MTNIEIQQEVYAAFGRGDVSAILDRVAEDVIWNMEGPSSIPYTGARRGHAEVLGFFAAIGGSETNSSVQVDRFLSDGDQVIALGRYNSTVTATGRSFSVGTAHVFQYRDGKIVRFDCYTDTATMADARVAAAQAV